MADINKPDLTNLWASDGAVIPPSPSKIKTGWVAEIPPHQWENFVQNRQDVALAYLLQKGVPEWDEKTEYIANKSFVQLGGDIYKCIQTNTGENPSTKPAYWKPLREVYSEELGLGSAAGADVVQSTGNNTANVMSQKAITDALGTKANLNQPGTMGLGVGQTWQNVSAQRSNDTTYTNTTGRPIHVVMRLGENSRLEVSQDGTTWIDIIGQGRLGGSSNTVTATAVIPAGHQYRTTGYSSWWAELR